MNTTTLSHLYSIASSVRDTYTETHGKCYPASKKVVKEISKEVKIDKSEIEIKEVRMGKGATIRHYIVAFPAKRISDSSASGSVYIDITLDQYCHENEECGKVKTSIGPRKNIPEVNIFESKAESPYTS